LSNPDQKFGKNKFVETFSKITEIATLLLGGPRSVMLPDDPTGLDFWLEPVIRLKANSLRTQTAESMAVYAPPHCIKHDTKSLVLLRHGTWEMGKDRDQCRKGGCAWPSFVVALKPLNASEVSTFDKLISDLDRSLSSLPFAVEGLDLAGPSGFKPLPPNAEIAPDPIRCELSRGTRFGYFELHWSAGTSTVDTCWRALWDACHNLARTPNEIPHSQFVEKYDIDPGKYVACPD
jgi:hypothetical protein